MCESCKKHSVPNLSPPPEIKRPMEEMQPIIPNETNMLTYIQSYGWVYAGDCGCKNNYATYTNYTESKYSSYRIWLPKAPKPMNNMQIRIVANRSTSIYRSAGIMNWKEVYDDVFNNNN